MQYCRRSAGLGVRCSSNSMVDTLACVDLGQVSSLGFYEIEILSDPASVDGLVKQ